VSPVAHAAAIMITAEGTSTSRHLMVT